MQVLAVSDQSEFDSFLRLLCPLSCSLAGASELQAMSDYEQRQLDNWLSLHELSEARHALDALGISAVAEMEHIQEDDLILEGVSPDLASRIVDVIHSTYAIKGLQKASPVPSSRHYPVARGRSGHANSSVDEGDDNDALSLRNGQRGYLQTEGSNSWRRQQQRHGMPVYPRIRGPEPRRGIIQEQGPAAKNIIDLVPRARRGNAHNDQPPVPPRSSQPTRPHELIAKPHVPTMGIAARRNAPPESQVAVYQRQLKSSARGGRTVAHGNSVHSDASSSYVPNYFSDSSDTDDSLTNDGLSVYSTLNGDGDEPELSSFQYQHQSHQPPKRLLHQNGGNGHGGSFRSRGSRSDSARRAHGASPHSTARQDERSSRLFSESPVRPVSRSPESGEDDSVDDSVQSGSTAGHANDPFDMRSPEEPLGKAHGLLQSHDGRSQRRPLSAHSLPRASQPLNISSDFDAGTHAPSNSNRGQGSDEKPNGLTSFDNSARPPPMPGATRQQAATVASNLQSLHKTNPVVRKASAPAPEKYKYLPSENQQRASGASLEFSLPEPLKRSVASVGEGLLEFAAWEPAKPLQRGPVPASPLPSRHDRTAAEFSNGGAPVSTKLERKSGTPVGKVQSAARGVPKHSNAPPHAKHTDDVESKSARNRSARPDLVAVEQAFEKMDDDGDGLISKAEFVRHVAATVAKASRGTVATVADVDGAQSGLQKVQNADFKADEDSDSDDYSDFDDEADVDESGHMSDSNDNAENMQSRTPLSSSDYDEDNGYAPYSHAANGQKGARDDDTGDDDDTNEDDAPSPPSAQLASSLVPKSSAKGEANEEVSFVGNIDLSVDLAVAKARAKKAIVAMSRAHRGEVQTLEKILDNYRRVQDINERLAVFEQETVDRTHQVQEEHIRALSERVKTGDTGSLSASTMPSNGTDASLQAMKDQLASLQVSKDRSSLKEELCDSKDGGALESANRGQKNRTLPSRVEAVSRTPMLPGPSGGSLGQMTAPSPKQVLWQARTRGNGSGSGGNVGLKQPQPHLQRQQDRDNATAMSSVASTASSTPRVAPRVQAGESPMNRDQVAAIIRKKTGSNPRANAPGESGGSKMPSGRKSSENDILSSAHLSFQLRNSSDAGRRPPAPENTASAVQALRETENNFYRAFMQASQADSAN